MGEIGGRAWGALRGKDRSVGGKVAGETAGKCETACVDGGGARVGVCAIERLPLYTTDAGEENVGVHIDG